MKSSQPLTQRLIDVDDCLLVVIDIQDSFLDKYDNTVSDQLLAKVEWLLQVAALLRVPVVAMAEDITFTGELNSRIQNALPGQTKVFDKNAFGLADNPEILDAVKATARSTAILVGVETDVCVCQSALGLLEQGFQVAVVADAVATTSEADQETGIGRMREAGVAVTSVKALYYEWLRSVSNTRELLERRSTARY